MNTLGVVLAGVLALPPLTMQAGATRQSAPDPAIHLATTVPARQLALTIGTDRTPVRPGQPLTLVVAVTPRPRMHVYAPGEPDYIPIDLTVDKGAGYQVAAEGPVYPAARQMYLEAVNQRVRVYDRPFRITVPMAVSRTPGSGPLEVTGTLRYQACDDSVCYRPESVKLAWKIPVQ
jgi:hypothetical protein